ncbi:MAG: hypothetical protein M5U01_02440 [Ardenticatenaceae bacterium]|nr:hypothetical protein [Ardenticatenaceae bacterium]HBY97704.1 hypothetical protein [Chloroflexota bacterium]
MDIVLSLHSLNRWLIIALAVIVTLLSAWGYFAKRLYTPLEDRLGLIYVALLDIQILLGVLLFLLGHISQSSVLHALVMLTAIVVAHIGRARARRANLPAAKHVMQGLGSFLSLAIIGGGLPFVT